MKIVGKCCITIMIMLFIMVTSSWAATGRSVTFKVAAVILLKIDKDRVTVRDRAGKTATYQISQTLKARGSLAKFKAGDIINIKIQNRKLVRLDKSPAAIKTLAKAGQTKKKIREMQARATAGQQRLTLPSGIDRSSISGPKGTAGRAKPQLENPAKRKSDISFMGSKNARVGNVLPGFVRTSGQNTPDPANATADQYRKADIKEAAKSMQGGDPRVSKNDQVKIVVGRIWGKFQKLMGREEKEWKPAVGGGGGVRGYCPEGSAICHATGKTWEKMSAQEKKGICEAVSKEIDKVKGANEPGANVSTCAGSRKEPNWEKIMGDKLDRLILTTEDQGRRGGSKTVIPVQPAKGIRTNVKGSLVGPQNPEIGPRPGTVSPKPDPRR